MVSGNYLSHMRFSSYTDVNHNNNPNSNPAYVFALGSVTPQADMPKSESYLRRFSPSQPHRRRRV